MMMVTPTLAFGFSTPDIILILVVALVLFGPKNLPKMARGIGKSMEEFRRAAREIENEIMKEPEPTTPPPPPPPSTPELEAHPEETSEQLSEQTPLPEDSASAAKPHTAAPKPVVIADAPVALSGAQPAGAVPSTPPAVVAAPPAQPPAGKVSDVTKPAA